MLSLRAPLPLLRGMLALMVSMLVLLSGVAQQRAFAAKPLLGAGQMQLCLPGMDGSSGQPADTALHDCFECCLGAPVAVPMPGAAQMLAPVRPVARAMAIARPLPADRASERPPSRGPPRQG